MREIEVKARITNKQAILRAVTDSGGVMSSPAIHHDRVYGLRGVAGASENHEPWLRVRTETKGEDVTHYFTLKKSVTNQLDSIEHETVVVDDAETESIIDQLGFVPYSDLTKTRQKAKMGDIEVCIDHLDELGDFIEAEKLTADDIDYAAVVEELWQLLESIGVSRTDEVTDGYDVLLNKHRGIDT